MLKKVIRIALVLISLLLLWQHQLIIYGVSQLRGQLNVILNSKEISDVLADPGIPDSVKYQLNLIQEIKQFTVDSLGFEPNDNYTSYFDQKGKPSLLDNTGSLNHPKVDQPPATLKLVSQSSRSNFRSSASAFA